MSAKALAHLRADKRLGPVIDCVGEYKIRRVRNRYECLIGAIINQQLSGSAARSIRSRFCEMYSDRFPRPADVAATRDSALRRVGLSSMKVSYVKGISREIESGSLRFDRIAKMDDESAITSLSSVRGIGRWTAQMYLMFALGRTDILPTGDLGLRTGVEKLYSLKSTPTPKQIERIAEKWRPYRTVATWYIWRGMQGFGEL